jgi:hypothetical protein
MVHRKAPSILLGLIVLGGVGYLANAGMNPNATRKVPYSGYLEMNGAPAPSGDYEINFGLFSSAGGDDSCLTTDPTACGQWGESQTTTVSAGRFSVILGDGTGDTLDDSVIDTDQLFVGMAVKGPLDNDFVLLGKQEIVPVPLAARAAAANNYKVTGNLTVGNGLDVTAGGATIEGGLDVGSGGASITGAMSATGQLSGTRLRLSQNQDAQGDNNAGSIVIGDTAAGNLGLDANEIMARNNAVPTTLFINNNGGDVTVGNAASQVTVRGDMAVNGELSFSCPAGWDRYGEWCIEDNLRGPDTHTNAWSACHTVGGSLCPIAALMACDIIGPAGTACRASTDAAGWHWTSTIIGNDVDAFDAIAVYNHSGNNAGNEIDISTEASSYQYYCCRAAGGP